MINIGKKCLAALLAASMVFGVTGCGKQKKAKKPYVQSTAEVKNGTAKAEGKGKQQSEVPLIIGCGSANAVKLEGGAAVVEQIKAITAAGIPVMGHLGLTPQSINAFGGNKVQGKSEEAAKKLIEDALAVQEAGAFAVVLECIPAKLASIITKKLTIPTIGIGAGAGCDGQILVYQDMLGMFSDYVPKFVKRFADVGSVMKEAFQAYGDEVRAGSYPAQEHTFQISDDVLDKLY